MKPNNRGISKENLGDLNGACADWKRADSMGNRIAQNNIRDFCN